ncbi:MAG: lipid II flippase MurJ [bacterium]
MREKAVSTHRPLSHRILRAGMAVSIAHVLFKLAGLVQAKAMGHYLSPQEFDVLTFAFENCIFGVFLIGEEVIGPAAMPVFMRQLDLEGESSAWRFANTLLTFQVLVLVPVIALLLLFPEALVQICTQWTPEKKPELVAMGSRYVRALAPALAGLSIGSTTYVLLNGHKRFFLAAFGDAVWKFAAVGGLLAAVIFQGGGNVGRGLILGLLLGSVLKVATHLVGLRDKLHLFRPRFAFSDPAFQRMLWLALPLLAGILVAKARDLFNNVYVPSGADSAGLIQALSMGKKLQGTVSFLVPYAFSIAVFPFFCELVDRNDHARLGRVITRSGRMLLACFIPLVAVIAVLAQPLTALLFAGGRFDALAVERTSVAMACCTLVLPATAIEMLAMQAFFAHRRMVAVTGVGIVFSLLSMAISWAGFRLCGSNSLLLLGVIAGGFSLSRVLKSLTLVKMLRASTPLAFPVRETLLFLLRVLACALLMAGAAWLMARGTSHLAAAAGLHLGGRLLDMARLGGGSAAALVAGAAALWLLRIHEPREMVQWVLARAKGKLKRGDAKGPRL